MALADPAAQSARFEPATEPRSLAATRLLAATVTRGELGLRDARFAELVDLLRPGDVCVVNDAATLPASIFARTSLGETMEVRLLGPPDARGETEALLFGGGDWRTPTERRPLPPRLEAGDEVHAGELRGVVVSVRPGGRLARLRFAGARDETMRAIYAVGHPVQYAHIRDRLPLWEVQNVYASEPWAVEMPSAGRPLDFATIAALRARGVEVVAVTHGAGLSSTGDPSLDATLPWVERYRIPARTAEAVNGARRVIAVGTSVVRALEACSLRHGEVRPVQLETTDLRIDARHQLRTVTGLLTGLHDAASSHAELLAAFLPGMLLDRLTAHALEAGYLGHEFGDSCLILRG